MFSFRNIREALVVLSALMFAGLVVTLGATGVSVFSSPLWWACVVLFILMEAGLATMVSHDPVDPWECQRTLMRMSYQSTPGVPTMTRDTLTYFALCLEEVAELGQALTRWSLPWTRPGLSEPSPFSDRHLGTVLMQIGVASQRAAEDANTIRRYVEKVDKGWFRSLPRDEAKEVLDGATDLAVVTCGMCVATGLPGAAAYTEVVNSNLSKADPVTNRIDKDASGKWIKGPAYVKPDLDKVLDQALADQTFPTWFGGMR